MLQVFSRFFSSKKFPILLTAIFMILGGISAFYHEMWRDEIQAWLIARDSTSIIDLCRNLKYEGHPGLWHLCLMPLTIVTRSPIAMQILHLMIAGAVVYIFCRYSPFRSFQKILFAFGYFVFYEYGILCRNYALGVLLIVIFCALFEKRFTKFPLIGLVLFLLAHTSVHCTIIATAIMVSLLTEYLFRLRRLPEGSIRWQIHIGFLIMALGIATSVLQMNPPVDSGFATVWVTNYDVGRVKNVFRILARAFNPIPKSVFNYWNSNIVDTLSSAVKVKSIISWAVVIWMFIILLRKPLSLIIYVGSTVGLLAFFYTKYFGAMRHHGFLFIVLIASIWVSHYCGDIKRPRIIGSPLLFLRKYLLDVPLTLILLAQLVGGVAAARMDYRYIFSQGRATARYIRESGMKDMPMVGHSDFVASTVIGYLGGDIYYVRGDRSGSFVIWDKARTSDITTENVIQTARKLSDEKKQDVLIILSYALDANARSKYSLTEVAKFAPAVVADEVDYLYLLKFTDRGE